MKQLNRKNYSCPQYPTKIIQFGEGNFLRAFIDWQIDLLNEKTDLNAGVTLIRPINSKFPPSLNTQDGLYTTIIRGLNEQGQAVKDIRVISSVNNEINIYEQFDEYLALARNPQIEIVFSNTTEAGISFNAGDKFDDVPPESYPAKLTRLLHERFQYFNGAADKGWTLIPCELIDYNGEALKELVLRYAKLWRLNAEFITWINNHNVFCSTLVDRIVTGYPRNESEQLAKELGYQDNFLDTAEYFYLFVIQGPKTLAKTLRLDQLDLNIIIVDDIKPYKERKVAILNGAHTALVPVAYLAGLDYVGEAMEDPQISRFVEQTIFNEIVPVLSLSQEELISFAKAVINRFRNPFIQHQLLSISLNSMTKFRTRILPQLQSYREKNGTWPVNLTFSLASLITFYRGIRNNEPIPLQDDEIWLNRFDTLWSQLQQEEITFHQLVHNVLQQTDHWGINLSQYTDLVDLVSEQLQYIENQGMRAAITHYCAC